jgi:hypothetical protein
MIRLFHFYFIEINFKHPVCMCVCVCVCVCANFTFYFTTVSFSYRNTCNKRGQRQGCLEHIYHTATQFILKDQVDLTKHVNINCLLLFGMCMPVLYKIYSIKFCIWIFKETTTKMSLCRRHTE